MLSPRMHAITSLLGRNNLVADIGCDHGKLSVYLLKNELANVVYATDISSLSLEKAKKLAQKENITNISFYIGDGFLCLPQRPDAAIIAGMGGEVIANIIENDFAKTKLVLQPMKDTDILYKKLYELGFYIEKVMIVRESNRFYEVILALPGVDKPFDYDLPPIERLIHNDDALLFLNHKRLVLSKALDGALKANNFKGKERYNELNKKIQMIDGVINDGYSK